MVLIFWDVIINECDKKSSNLFYILALIKEKKQAKNVKVFAEGF